MNRPHSKRWIITLAILSFLIGSVPVYASQYIQSDLLPMIQLVFDHKMPTFFDTINSNTEALVENKNERIDSYITSSTNHVVGQVEQHIDQEKLRIDQELTSYLDVLLEELDDIMDGEEQRLKTIVTNYYNDRVKEVKQELREEVNDELRKHILDELNAQ
ncbi:MAG: hypothetical protein K0S47_3037 [Herbinix sp.]|nr:hypothetical protein [Herbinix sp.]